jgi:hypothetical protein
VSTPFSRSTAGIETDLSLPSSSSSATTVLSQIRRRHLVADPSPPQPTRRGATPLTRRAAAGVAHTQRRHSGAAHGRGHSV